MPDDFYKIIYSKFNAETIANVDYQSLASFLTNTYKLPLPASEKILFDVSTKHDYKLNKYKYEYVMKQLYKVDKIVLARRIEIFKNYDSNKDGYLDKEELYELFSNMKFGKKLTREYFSLYSVDYCMYTFDKNGDGKLNFLDFNKYMTIASIKHRK